MTEQMYDPIAEQYRDSKRLQFRYYIERFTLFEVLGDLTGLRVLELACGDGWYARQWKRAGAAEVTGVDISPEMNALAEDYERKAPQGCRYVCAEAADYTPPEPVDVVTAVYLFNYARTREELGRMMAGCVRALRSGGRLVGFNDNVRRPPRSGVSLLKYGIERTCAYPPAEGDVIRYRLTNDDDESFEFDNYYLAPKTYQAAAREAGLADFRWIDAALEPNEREDPFWDDFLAVAPLTGFRAVKG